MRVHDLFGLALLAALMLSSGCATTLSTGTPEPSSTNQVTTVPANTFKLEARLSIRQGQKIDSANIVWQKSIEAQSINITGPLGVQVAKITRRGNDAATLSRGDDAPVERAENLDALVAQTLGVPIRVDTIINWVQLIGLPAEGEITLIKIDGVAWQVSAETTQQISGKTIAQRLVARAGDITIKLFVDAWQNLDDTPK